MENHQFWIFVILEVLVIAGIILVFLYRSNRRLKQLAETLASQSVGAGGSKYPGYLDEQIEKTREKLDFISGLLRTFGMISMRQGGLRNDMTQLTTMPIYPLEKIEAPSLILHGREDKLVPFSHAEFIANTVPDSKLLDIEGGGHLFLATHKHQVVPAVIEFLKNSAY